MTNNLAGVVVVSPTFGVGKITSDDGYQLQVEVGVDPRIIEKESVDVQRYSERMIMDVLAEYPNGMTVTSPIDTFLDNSEWTTAPSSLQTEKVLHSVSSMRSNVVLPTKMPRTSWEIKRKMEEKHLDYLRHEQFTIDDELAGILYQITTIVDTQIALFLLRSNGENIYQYQERLATLKESLLVDAWSRVILSETPEESVTRILRCCAFLASIIHAQGNGSLVSAVQTVVSHVESRLELHEGAISGMEPPRRRSH